MTVIGNPRSFHKKFKFIVEIDDVGHAGFQKCSELSVEVANVQYFEGGSLIPNKSPGRLTFSDVTLERGATQDRDLFDWFQDVAITSSGLGLTDVNYKRNLDIVQQDRDGTDPAPLVALARVAGEVRRRRVGQRERRERHRVGHAHVRLLRARAVIFTGFSKPSRCSSHVKLWIGTRRRGAMLRANSSRSSREA
jgi:phage tail-like protein